jgi:hypothetical protein
LWWFLAVSDRIRHNLAGWTAPVHHPRSLWWFLAVSEPIRHKPAGGAA